MTGRKFPGGTRVPMRAASRPNAHRRLGSIAGRLGQGRPRPHVPSMSDDDKTPTEKLAEVVKRKAAARAQSRKAPGVGSTERAASARAASQAKPALRKS
jgi:hypothetical protein